MTDDDYFSRPRPTTAQIIAGAVIWLMLIAAVVMFLAAFFMAATARAHEASTGWQYPVLCCPAQEGAK